MMDCQVIVSRPLSKTVWGGKNVRLARAAIRPRLAGQKDPTIGTLDINKVDESRSFRVRSSASTERREISKFRPAP
jgi:hypothetical protein